MKIVQFYSPGNAAVQQIEQAPIPPVGPRDIRIKVAAIGLNRSDITYRSGHHPIKPPSPSCNGAEAVGYVDAIGSEASEWGFTHGQRVAVAPHMNPERGTYAEYICVAAERVLTVPEKLTDLEAAAFWASYMTAYGGLIYQAQLAEGDAVIIPAASSSVGLAAIQIAEAVGAIPIALTRSPAKKERLNAMGLAHVFLADAEDLPEQILHCTGGKGARVVFDPVGGNTTPVLAQAMAANSIYVLFGVLRPEATPFPVMAAFQKQLSMTVYKLDIINQPEVMRAAQTFLQHHLARGALKPLIDRVFDFDEMVAAHEYMESNQQFGKIVIQLD